MKNKAMCTCVFCLDAEILGRRRPQQVNNPSPRLQRSLPNRNPSHQGFTTKSSVDFCTASIAPILAETMESLLEGLEENRLDALYLFITDVLRDAAAFRRFFDNLITVLPTCYSVHRIEVGHEFLKQIGDLDQRRVFQIMTEIESLRTLIVSDGYVQRKDHGSVCTRAFLTELPRARSLVNLDIHRMELANTAQVELLAEACSSLNESLEEVRLTGLFVNHEDHPKYCLDPVVETILEMPHIRSLTLSLYPDAHDEKQRVVSPGLFTELCQLTTLQDLTLRSFNLDDQACFKMAEALEIASFLTTLDLRQNKCIRRPGLSCMLNAMDQNFSSWCTVMVDDPQFQGRFMVLIELNQADRGDVVRNFSSEKFIDFVETLNEPPARGRAPLPPSALWYFLQLHDTCRDPLANYLLWKERHNKEKDSRLQRKRKLEQTDDELVNIAPQTELTVHE